MGKNQQQNDKAKNNIYGENHSKTRGNQKTHVDIENLRRRQLQQQQGMKIFVIVGHKLTK